MVESFENGIQKTITVDHAEIALDSSYAKDGRYSLRWQGEGKSCLHMKCEVGYQPFQEGGIRKDIDGFVFWVYQKERRKEDVLWVTFLKEGKPCCKFPFGLSFSGWRTCWCPFMDMEGEAELDMDEIQFEIESEGEFCLYLDQIITAVPMDSRHPVRDYQVPFVNRKADTSANAHWTSLYRFHQMYRENSIRKNSILSDTCGQQEKKQEQEQIAQKMERYLLSHSTFPTVGNLLVTEDECQELILYGRELLGHHVDSSYHKAVYPEAEREQLMKLTDSVDIKVYSQTLLNLAYCFRSASVEQKKRIRDLFSSMLSHLLEEGWAEGSSLGTTHHMGYPMRAFYPAVFLMRDEIEGSLRADIVSMMVWYSGCGRIFREIEELTEESMDTLNTLLQGIVFSILMLDTIEQRDCCLMALCRWLSHSLQPASGLEGPFKRDGSVFHHCGHYPAYAMGGLTGIAPVVYALSKTSYALGQEAHESIRNCLLTMRFYCNRLQWLISMSSRHPRGVGEMSQISNLEPFYYMALAGNETQEENKDDLDREMAGALLRLSEGTHFWGAEELAKKGIQPETAPQGHITMSYACASLHRRDEWLAGVRGHSRYLWGSEIYEKNNLFGRYITYGNLQILGSGHPINQADSGFFQEGWDWNCWPGTTAPSITLDRLKARVRVVDTSAGMEEMLLSDETFAGGVQMDGQNGVFAMKLHGHEKYDGSFRARKSWFFFDDKILCLGSDIEDKDPSAKVCTTLFQHYMGKDMEYSMWTEQGIEIGSVGAEKEYRTEERGMLLADPSGNVYCIPKGQKIVLTEGMQESLSQDLAEPTRAPFSKAYLSHGSQPEQGEYSYLIWVKAGKREAEALAKETREHAWLADYQILQKNRQAHIVFEKKTKTMAYVLFEAGSVGQECNPKSSQEKNQENNQESKESNQENKESTTGAGNNGFFGQIVETDTPCMVMEQREGDTLKLCVSDPNLHLYEGVEEDQMDKNGLQKEVSLYSRTWAGNESKESFVCLTLLGEWKLPEGARQEHITLHKMNGKTKVSITCKDGLTTSCSLSK